MCGIGGCVVPPGAAVPRAALERMAAAMRHRGPDDSGIEVVGNVGLVHTRLAIVDPTPVGHAPMASADGRWWLTYNGEAFNHLELRAALGGRSWRGGSDTETVVEAFAAWGDDAVERVNGLFGLAALDVARRRLVLARDRFGVKPLYLARFGGALWFASEMRALLAAGAPREADPQLLLQAIAAGWVTGPWTPLRGVRAVLPGTLVEVSLDTLVESERTWYAPEAVVDAERAGALARQDRGALRAELENALRVSVRRRLMGDVPVATMCSGGVDSGLITALAREEGPGLQAFNVAIADQPEHDEGRYAAMVAAQLGVPLHTFTQTAASWREGFVRTLAHVEYPLLHPSSVPMAQVAALARSQGVKVLLSGEGADELFGGYGFLHVEERAAFERSQSPLRAALARLVHGRGGAAPGAAAPDARGLAPEVDEWEAALAERCEAAYAHHGGPRRALEAGLLADLRTYLPHLLNRQDKTTMQASIETRVPFLDPDVVALALNLPLEARVGPEPKGLVRELGLARLPEAAVRRPKRGFGFDADRYLDGAADPEFLLDGHLRELLGRDSASWREGVAASKFHLTLLLWSAEAWCRLLLDDQPPERVEADLWRDREAPVAAAQTTGAAPG